MAGAPSWIAEAAEAAGAAVAAVAAGALRRRPATRPVRSADAALKTESLLIEGVDPEAGPLGW